MWVFIVCTLELIPGFLVGHHLQSVTAPAKSDNCAQKGPEFAAVEFQTQEASGHALGPPTFLHRHSNGAYWSTRKQAGPTLQEPILRSP